MWTRLHAWLARTRLPRCNWCRALVADEPQPMRYAYCSDACREADAEAQALQP